MGCLFEYLYIVTILHPRLVEVKIFVMVQVQSVTLQQEAFSYTKFTASEDGLLTLNKPLAPENPPFEELQESIYHRWYEGLFQVREDWVSDVENGTDSEKEIAALDLFLTLGCLFTPEFKYWEQSILAVKMLASKFGIAGQAHR